ncbi:hypothetical protein [Rhizobium lusitanum]|uniref:hypothetical protein n=1 Tax=Rhizobium lusitanum TaxID=293958 RepID=UPI00195A770B|nr:hypothetical protein [Rhizobium lusitanum]MBM7045213.1 hypothetical protein [Rhizobium lusitanum]
MNAHIRPEALMSLRTIRNYEVICEFKPGDLVTQRDEYVPCRVLRRSLSARGQRIYYLQTIGEAELHYRWAPELALKIIFTWDDTLELPFSENLSIDYVHRHHLRQMEPA